MTDFTKKSFSVPVGTEKSYRDGWDRIFGKEVPPAEPLMHGLAFDRKSTRCGLAFDQARWTSKDENITCRGCKP